MTTRKYANDAKVPADTPKVLMTSTLLGVRASTGTVPHSVESMADDTYAFITEEREDASGSAVVRLGVAGRDVVDVDTA